MKKSYVKPQVYFEDFQLSASIAAGCEVINTLHAENQCGFNDGVEVIYLTQEICDYVQDDGADGKICYHMPDQSNNLFTSA